MCVQSLGGLAECQEPTTEVLATRDRYRLLDELRSISVSERTRVCGRLRMQAEVQFEVRDGRVRSIGVCRCGGIHGCPVCAGKLYAIRARELDFVVGRWIDWGEDRIGPPGAWAGLLTLTVKHGLGDDVATVRAGMAAAWRGLRQGRAWQRLRDKLGERHFARAFEATFGKQGWHPHFHVLFLGDREPPAEAVRELAERWADCVEEELGKAARPQIDLRFDRETHSYRPAIFDDGRADSIGVEFHAIKQERDGSYLAKMGLEVAGGHETKAAGRGNRTYWEVARDAGRRDPDSVREWQRVTRALKGSRQLTWSHGTRAWFGLNDLADAAAVRADETGELPLDGSPVSSIGTLHFVVTGHRWDLLCRGDRFFTSRLFALLREALRSGDWGSVVGLLAVELKTEGCLSISSQSPIRIPSATADPPQNSSADRACSASWNVSQSHNVTARSSAACEP